MTVHAPLTLLLTLCCSSAHAFDPAWQAVELLTFDTSTVGTDQSDVTIPIVLNASRINYSLAGPNGEQIRFVDDDDATVLDHEIESWDPAGTSVLWVRVPIVDGGSTSDHIYLYYDNPAATDVQNPAGAYDGSTELVFHFENNPPTDSLTGVASSNTGSTRVTGALGQGRQFDGINDYFSPSGTLSSLCRRSIS